VTVVVISAHLGLKAAIAKVFKATWQWWIPKNRETARLRRVFQQPAKPVSRRRPAEVDRHALRLDHDLVDRVGARDCFELGATSSCDLIKFGSKLVAYVARRIARTRSMSIFAYFARISVVWSGCWFAHVAVSFIAPTKRGTRSRFFSRQARVVTQMSITEPVQANQILVQPQGTS
jgi:hypothetical protein